MRNPGAGQDFTGLAAVVQLRLRVAFGMLAFDRRTKYNCTEEQYFLFYILIDFIVFTTWMCQHFADSPGGTSFRERGLRSERGLTMAEVAVQSRSLAPFLNSFPLCLRAP